MPLGQKGVLTIGIEWRQFIPIFLLARSVGMRGAANFVPTDTNKMPSYLLHIVMSFFAIPFISDESYFRNVGPIFTPSILVNQFM